MSNRILLIDDDPDLIRLVCHELRDHELDVDAAQSAQEGLDMAAGRPYGVVILDLHLPDMDGKEVLDRLKEKYPDLPVIILTTDDSTSEVVECMRRGAVDFVSKPFERVRLTASVGNALAKGHLQATVTTLTKELKRSSGFESMIGASGVLRESIELLSRASQSDVTVLLQGESGTGKEVAARGVHAESPRSKGPFVAINCGAIPEGIIESELFGHEKGAFTGACSERAGCFEEANGGTLFLDEVGELRPDLQVRMLRALQERVINRVGSHKPRPVDVRVIAATNRPLLEETQAGTFREDLYYRLAVFPVTLPALRDRGDDVLLLARAFLERSCRQHGRPLRGFTKEALECLSQHRWPGNVRELQNVIERAVILEDGSALDVGSLPAHLLNAAQIATTPAIVISDQGRTPVPSIQAVPAEVSTTPLGQRRLLPYDEEERRIIENALVALDWNVRKVAEALELGRATIYRKIERYGLAPRDQQRDVS